MKGVGAKGTTRKTKRGKGTIREARGKEEQRNVKFSFGYEI